MSRFFLEATNEDGEHCRLGGDHYITIHARGWTRGVQVRLTAHGDIDIITINKTNGTHDPVPREILCEETATTDPEMKGL